MVVTGVADINIAKMADSLVEALNADEGFTEETRWFDGSILLEVGEGRLWLKIYRGRIIDHLDVLPVFGCTFQMSGSERAWEMLVRGERTFTDLIASGTRHLTSWDDPEIEGGGLRAPEIRIEGNQFEAGRIHIGLRHLSRVFAATAASA